MTNQLNLFQKEPLPNKPILFARVVNLKKEKSYDVYCGRGSIFGNIFKIGIDGNREQVIEKFKEYFYSNPDLMQKAKEQLSGKVIACFCKPQKCHCDILANYVNSFLTGDKNEMD